MKVTVERIRAIQAERAKINNAPLHEIEFYENGVKLEIDKTIFDHFEFTGLNNIDFILSGYYKKKDLIGILSYHHPCGCLKAKDVEIMGKNQCACGLRR